MQIKEHNVDGLYVKEVIPTHQVFHPTLYFLHGSFHGAWAWAEWQEIFAQAGWRSLAPSVRNHPGSYSMSDEDYCRLTSADYVDDILRVYEHFGGPAVLMGHSMGGLLAQKAAETIQPEAVVGLTAVSPAEIGPVRDSELDESEPFLMPKERMRSFLFNEVSDEDFDEFYSQLVPESPSVMNTTGGGRTSVDPKKIKCPFFFIGAGKDGAGVHPAPRLANYFGGEYVEFPEAGHEVTHDACGSAVAALVNAWLVLKVGVIGASTLPIKTA